MSILILVVLATAFISTLSLVGGLLLIKKSLFTNEVVPYFVSFAAGTMLGASFFGVLPEALHEGDTRAVLFLALTGIVMSFALERFLLWHHHHHEVSHKIKPSAFITLVGDGLHNFADGVAIAAAFLVNPVVGSTTTLAIAAHEIPQELADFSILIHSGFSNKKALFANFASALTALFGALTGFFFLTAFEGFLSLVLGLSAGMFIYIACADLIPELHKKSLHEKEWVQIIPFLFGIFIMFVLVSTIGDH